MESDKACKKIASVIAVILDLVVVNPKKKKNNVNVTIVHVVSPKKNVIVKIVIAAINNPALVPANVVLNVKEKNLVNPKTANVRTVLVAKTKVNNKKKVAKDVNANAVKMINVVLQNKKLND